MAAILFCIVSITPSCGQSKKALPENVISSIQKRIKDEINPSIVVGIVDKNGSVFYNFGKTSADGQSADEHTIYEIGSISKVFTAILLAQQVNQGTMSLNDPINQYLPTEIKVPVIGSNEITLGNLSDHTSGLPRLPQNLLPANPNNPYADYTVDQLYEFISTYEPIRAVGAEYEYSNLAQGLLGHILALKANITYDALMIDNIASPLKMEETKIVLDRKMRDNLAIGHNNGAETANWDIPTLAGAGAIRSSTSDMLKFLGANLGFTETTLKPAVELSHKIRHNKAGGMRVGLAWHVKDGVDGDVIWHNGGTGGYRSFAGFVKEMGKGVVVLTNSSVSVDDIGFHLLDPSSELTDVQTKSDAIQVSEETLQTYIGNYELQPGFSITVTREGAQLFAQATGQDKFKLHAKNDTEFYLTVVKASVTFQVKDGTVESLTLFQNGQELLGKRKNIDQNEPDSNPDAIQVPEEILESYVGNYEIQPRFMIAITREGSQLFEQALDRGNLSYLPKVTLSST